MMEVSMASSTVTEASLITSDSNLLTSDSIPVVAVGTLPLLTSADGTISSSLGGPTILNVDVPILRDGTILGTAGPHSLVLATNSDGTGTVLLDASQVTLLTQGGTAIYDESSILRFAAQHINSLQTSNLGESKCLLIEQSGVPEVTITVPTSSDLSPHPLTPEAIIENTAENENEEIQPPVGKGPHKCDICDKEYVKWNQLQKHIRSHAEDKPYRCDECDSSFNIESNLMLHKATHCADSPVCPECGKKFSRLASFKSHIMLHEKEENLICTECGDEFTTQVLLDRHMKEHKEEIILEKHYYCKQCLQKFSKATLLREHMKIHYKIKASLSHRTYKRNIDRSSFSHQCDVCGKLFQKPSQLIRHNRIHTGERPFRCRICDKAFNQKGALQIHMTKHSGERPHHCEFCPATFSQRGNLRAHIQRVHTLGDEIQQSLYQCEDCTCVFRKLGSLNAHMSRMHSGEFQTSGKEDNEDEIITASPKGTHIVEETLQQILKLTKQVTDNPEQTQQQIQEIVENGNVNSDILQQALENSGLAPKNSKEASPKKESPLRAMVMTVADTATGTLKRHIIRKVGGVKWHQCMYCSKEFKKPSDLVRHIRIHTHEKPFKCSQCFRAFAVKSTLTAHFRTHTGIKEFHCETCNKMFSTQGSLKVHLRLHTGAKPFSCYYCEKKFRTSGHRKSHLLSHTKESGIRKAKRKAKSQNKSDPLDDIPLQEPIFITDAGLLQQISKTSTIYNAEEEDGVYRPYKCAYCNRAFKRSSHLKQHIRSHTGEKPYKCNQCMRQFVSNGALKAHTRIHSGIKDYQCQICEATFTTNGSLKRHMSIHSENRPYMCPYCQKTFKTSMTCKKHMKTHRHELIIPGSNSEVTVTVVGDVVHGNIDGEAHETTVEANQNLSSQIIENLNGISGEDIHQEDPSENAQVTVTTLEPQSLVQETALSTQTFTQEALTQNLEHLQQSQFQQVFESQQINTTDLELSSLHSKQEGFEQSQNNFFTQTFTQMPGGGFPQNQFTLQADGLDVGALTGTFVTSSSALITEPLVTTSIANILQPQEVATQVAQLEVEASNQEALLSLEATEVNPGDIEDKNGAEESHEDNKGGKRSFRCSLCDKAFKKSSHLKQHIRSHTGEKPFRCLQCCRMFVSMGVLRAHVRTHTGIRDFKCNVCEAEFTTNGSLTRHMVIHSSSRPFSCSSCNETFRTNTMYRRHLKSHRGAVQEVSESIPVIQNGDSSKEAEIAEQNKNNISKKGRVPVIQLSDEQAEELAKQNPSETTSISEKVLIASAAEKNRISEIKDKISELEHLPKYANQCEHCPKSFKKPSDLVRHIRIHTGEKPFTCETCNKSFTVKSTLDSHQKIHTGVKNFSCHVCNSVFATKGSLKVHMRLHTGAKPFKCPHCNQRFRTSGHRKSHITTHFKESSRKRKQPEISGESDISGNILHSSLSNISTQTAGLSNIAIPTDAWNNFLAGISPELSQSQVVQGIEGIQLQLSPGLLGQSIEITGLDPSVLSKTVQIDSSLLQQLQRHININITITPNLLGESIAGSTSNQTEDSSIIKTLEADPSLQLNPNIIIQPLGIQIDSQSQILTSSDNRTEEPEIYISEVIEDKEQSEHGNNSISNSETVLNVEQNRTGTIAINVEEQPASVDESADLINSMHLLSVPVASDGMLDDVPSGTSFKCGHCKKDFRKLIQLEKHMDTHTKDKSFFCIHCPKFFKQKKDLHRHLKQHIEDNGHVCPYCSFKFSQKRNLGAHMKKCKANKSAQEGNSKVS